MKSYYGGLWDTTSHAYVCQESGTKVLHQGASERVRRGEVTPNKAWRKRAKPPHHQNLIVPLDKPSLAQWSLCVEGPEESHSLLAPVADTNTNLLANKCLEIRLAWRPNASNWFERLSIFSEGSQGFPFGEFVNARLLDMRIARRVDRA